MTDLEIEMKVQEICEQALHNVITYGEFYMFVDEDNNIKILTPDEIEEFRKEYDFSQLKPIDIP